MNCVQTPPGASRSVLDDGSGLRCGRVELSGSHASPGLSREAGVRVQSLACVCVLKRADEGAAPLVERFDGPVLCRMTTSIVHRAVCRIATCPHLSVSGPREQKLLLL